MQRSLERILTTHTGSLPRPPDVVEMLRAQEDGTGDLAALRARVRSAVAESVRQQLEAGVDVVSDGELGKPGYFLYLRHRLGGLEGLDPDPSYFKTNHDFPGYDEWRAAKAGRRRGIVPGRPLCVAPLRVRDGSAAQADVAALCAAVAGSAAADAFITAPSVGLVSQRFDDHYYGSEDAYLTAIAAVMSSEYRAITDAGLLLQVDAPEMAIDRNGPRFRDSTLAEFRAHLRKWVEALNEALRGIPPDRVRLHVCWGNGEAPHTLDVPLAHIVDVIMTANVGAFVLEASNPRHAHEWKVWRDTRLPEGKVLVAGVIDSTMNYVEHPELVAERIVRFANVVGRENLIAGVDCGFGTGATSDLIYPPVVWAKLRSLAEGARLASMELWR